MITPVDITNRNTLFSSATLTAENSRVSIDGNWNSLRKHFANELAAQGKYSKDILTGGNAWGPREFRSEIQGLVINQLISRYGSSLLGQMSIYWTCTQCNAGNGFPSNKYQLPAQIAALKKYYNDLLSEYNTAGLTLFYENLLYITDTNAGRDDLNLTADNGFNLASMQQELANAFIAGARTAPDEAEYLDATIRSINTQFRNYTAARDSLIQPLQQRLAQLEIEVARGGHLQEQKNLAQRVNSRDQDAFLTTFGVYDLVAISAAFSQAEHYLLQPSVVHNTQFLKVQPGVDDPSNPHVQHLIVHEGLKNQEGNISGITGFHENVASSQTGAGPGGSNAPSVSGTFFEKPQQRGQIPHLLIHDIQEALVSLLQQRNESFHNWLLFRDGRQVLEDCHEIDSILKQQKSRWQDISVWVVVHAIDAVLKVTSAYGDVRSVAKKQSEAKLPSGRSWG